MVLKQEKCITHVKISIGPASKSVIEVVEFRCPNVCKMLNS